eukprot:TRINITY_DN1353_c0_g1_i1.p1 TRINITY_DN1353_c0_g1~~TRINITY_DN1353_c0_g1_i1.p1  ORF type:complete len:840 (-),score=158.36 TRINITY_DN1353_c0_g1_i1:45-2564(-)
MSEWRQLGEQYYERVNLYSTKLDHVDFRKVNIIASNFGGPIAFAPHISVKLQHVEEFSASIDIYTPSGVRLSAISVSEFHGQIVAVGWNDNEQLVVILQDGTVMIYSVLGDLLRRFNLEGACKTQGILDAIIWGTGFVCITKQKFELYALLDFDSQIIIKLKNPVIKEPPKAWCIIEPQLSRSNNLEVLLAAENSILIISETLRLDMQLNLGNITKMAVSPTGQIIACYISSTSNSLAGQIWIASTDFATEFTKFNTRTPSSPDQLVFCSNDAVVCSWKKSDERKIPNDVMLVIGPTGDYFYYKEPSPIYLITEVDGVRIISSINCDFLSRVANTAVSLKKLDKLDVADSSTESPASILYKASKLYNEKNPISDSLIRDIQLDLPSAVSNLIDMATSEFDQNRQIEYLNAASFGISFIDFYAAKTFVPSVKVLRVLNSVRQTQIGIPLSYKQYLVLSPQLLIDRLISRDLHMLAFEICSYLDLNTDKVLIHWARRKVRSKARDEDIANSIVLRLKKCPGVSFASIAYEAVKADRFELATKLLDYEPKAADQVPLLIHMGKYENALSKAIVSGDSDLIHLVLLAYKQQHSNHVDFYNMLRKQKGARSTWENILKQTDPTELQNFYHSEGQTVPLALLELQKAYQTTEFDQQYKIVQNVHSLFKKSEPAAAKQTEDELKLLLIQRDLELSLGGTFVGSSLSNTLYRCMLMGKNKQAKKIRVDFQVPNKRWWWLKIRALSDSGRWANLKSFSKQRSPIGYKPFAEVCLKHSNDLEAMYYISLMPVSHDKVMLLVQLSRWEEVFDIVVKLEEPNDTLRKIRPKCTDPKFQRVIDDLITKYETD